METTVAQVISHLYQLININMSHVIKFTNILYKRLLIYFDNQSLF